MDDFSDIEEVVEVSLIDKLMDFELQRSVQRNTERSSEIHITDLIYCPKKRELAKLYPNLKAEVSLRPAVFHGKCFERGLQEVIRRWARKEGIKVRFNYKGKKRVYFNEKVYTIVGEADVVFLNEFDAIKTIIEVKDKIWNLTASDNYIMQGKLYGWLFDVNDVRLWLFTNRGGKGYKEIKLKGEKMTDDEVIVLLDNLLNEKRFPFWDWECDYCPFRNVCDKYIMRE